MFHQFESVANIDNPLNVFLILCFLKDRALTSIHSFFGIADSQ